jgi:hypothetical protein
LQISGVDNVNHVALSEGPAVFRSLNQYFFGVGWSSRWVRSDEVLEVIECEAMLWPVAARLKGVSDEREGIKKAPAPLFWTVGVEEMPAH